MDDPAQEWQRLSELYRQKTEEELLVLAQQFSELTEIAHQVLTREMSSRGLKAPAIDPVKQISEPERALDLDPTSPYAEDRKLVDIATVWSMRDALQLQGLLNMGGIPFFMGTEESTRAESVTSNFSEGVRVQTMNFCKPWVTEATKNYSPEDVPDSEKVIVDEGLAIRCPKCHSEDVVLEDFVTEPETTAAPGSKYDWTCDSCGHRWEDEGIETA